MMVTSLTFGSYAPRITLPSIMALRVGCCRPQQPAVSVRGLMPEASRMNSTLRPTSRSLSGTGDSGLSRCFLSRESPGLRGDQTKGSFVLQRRLPRRYSRDKVRCAAIATEPGLDVTPAQMVRAILFYLTTFVLIVANFFARLILQPFVLVFDKQGRKVQHFVNEELWATLTTRMFYKTEVEGWENLPAADEGAVYVANHQSLLDIYALFELRRPFKFISKTSNFFIPFIGWCMYLTGHIPLKRMDKRSQLDCVKEGVPIVFFPEATRTTDGAMAAFKKGAFVVAVKGGVPIVPITLIDPSYCQMV